MPGKAGSQLAPPTVLGQLFRPIRPTSIRPALPRGHRTREERAREDEHLQLLSSAMEATLDGIIITQTDGTIVWVNPAFTRMTGYRPEEVIGFNPRILKSGRHDDAFYLALWNTILAGDTWQGELFNKRRDGTIYPEEMTIAPIRDRRSELTHFVAVKRDVTHRTPPEALLVPENRKVVVQQLAAGLADEWNDSPDDTPSGP